MTIFERVSTGLLGVDEVIDHLRLGDNVVWQVNKVEDYKNVVLPFVDQALKDQRKLIYFRFGDHDSLLEENEHIQVIELDPSKGFENFATEIHYKVKEAGKKAFYVFDSLTDLLKYWNSDLMIGNFFNVTCPYLYELDTVAYFAIVRDAHTFTTIAGIRETTQLLLELYQVCGKCYLHPLKVWERYSPTMFFPHLIQGQEAISITASTEVAELFSTILRSYDRMDYWNITFQKAKESLTKTPELQQEIKLHLLHLLIGNESRMFQLCNRYFSLFDLIQIASREIGTGYIGGKSIGMLLARKILEVEEGETILPLMEPHDSFYLGADIFYTYIVQNGWWKLRTKQKTKDGYFKYASELKEKLLLGKFPKEIKEQFMQMLEYFGQSPIIVRSSSLLEDNFGNAFAGKYESVFCANQGTPEERFHNFEQAIRVVYASTMNQDALEYRMNRGLWELDEQMAILIQRVSGDQYGDCFFPHLAGVGNSSNLYVWDKQIDMEAGMLRLVFGLGTRAVDRVPGDYARIVCLDDPMRISPMYSEDEKKYSQHGTDVISLKNNQLESVDMNQLFQLDLKVDKTLFAEVDYEAQDRLKQLGFKEEATPYHLNLKKVLRNSKFPGFMKQILSCLSKVYEYPVDVEFTVNYMDETHFKVNILQCRPLQTKGLGYAVEMPDISNSNDFIFSSRGNFMGGNVRLPIDYIVYVDPDAYQELHEQQKYQVAREIGKINTLLKEQQVMLMGPGRWGTTTPKLGVPVHFSELSNMKVICEVSSSNGGFMPELSYGSHFFQDLVETGIFYVAVIDGLEGVIYHPDHIKIKENILSTIHPQALPYEHVIRIVETRGSEIFSDILTQRVLLL